MMTKKKKPNKSQVELPGEPGEQDPASTDTRAMRVEVTRIKFYERNPRHGKNPEYDRIKASILVSGMDQPLLITKRPGDEDYIVQAGGNTRLRILKELFEATGEGRFQWVDCFLIEWDCESSVLLAHMRENELRGDLTFIDKAQAVFDAKTLITKELGVSDMSHRELESTLREHGYSASCSLISLMGYAVSILLPLLPTALAVGLGKPQVQRIRTLERVGREIWCLRGAGAEAEFDAAFEALCQRYDGLDWHFDSLLQAIENEISEAADVNIQVIRMEFDFRLSGRVPDIPDFVYEEETPDDEFPISARDEPAIVSEAERKAAAITSSESADGPPTNDKLPDDGSLEVSVELPPVDDNEALFRRIGVQLTNRVPIELLRETAYTLAQRLAERHGIADLIEPLLDNGLGFVVRDIPAASIVDQLDDELQAQVSTMWWQLTAFAEMAVAPADVLEKVLDEDSTLGVAVLAGEGSRLSETVRSVEPAHLAQRFWRQLNHGDWCDWVCLAHNYRELHRMASKLNTPLWSTTT